MKQLSGQIDGDTITASDFNQIPAEIQFVITSSGITLAAALDQFAKALANYAARGNFYTGAGVADAEVLNKLTGFSQGVGYADGMVAHWRPANANTGATTIAVDGFAVVDLVKETTGGALAANDLITTKDAKARYDVASGDFFLLGV